MLEQMEFFLQMSPTDLLLLIAGTAGIALTVRVAINRSKKSSSKQSAKARDGANIEQKHIHVDGDYHHHETAATASDPKVPPLSDEERYLLTLIEPGRYFTCGPRLANRCVIYHETRDRHREFFNRDDPMFATRHIEALESLVDRGLLNHLVDSYKLTVNGDNLRKSLLQSSS